MFTQEEQAHIDSCQKDAAEHGFKWVQKPDGDWAVERINHNKKCSDCGSLEFDTYVGFSNSFEYCKKCGKEYKQ